MDIEGDMYEVWMDGTCWLHMPSIDACKKMMRTFDPDGTVLMLIRDTESQRFLSHQEVWGGPIPFFPSQSEKPKEKIDWILDGF